MSGGLSSGARLRVMRGNPTAKELAAVVVALDAVAAGQQPAEAVPAMPAWTRAARLEAVGGRPLAGAPDLRASARPPYSTVIVPSMPACRWPGTEQ